MAQETETLLFEVILDIPQLKEKAEIARTAIAQLRQEKAATEKEFKGGSIGIEEYVKSMEAIDGQLTRVQGQYKGYQKTLADNETATKSAKGSNEQLKAQLALLAPVYGSMSKEMRVSSDIGKRLTATMSEITEELKKNESAVGSTSRNVGNYSQAIFQAISPNNSLIEKIKGASVAMAGFREQTKTQVTALKATAGGMSVAEKATFAFGLTLKGLGIGLIITAIAALVGFLTKMDAGMDRVKQATAGVSAAVMALIQQIAPLGEAIVNAVIHPIDSIVALGKALLHPIDSGKQLINATLGIAGAMSQAARAAVDYTKTMQIIEDKQISLIGKSAQVKQQVDLAILAAEDQSRSYKERITLLNDAGKVELALAKQTVSLETQKLKAIIALNKAKKDNGETLQRADLRAYEEQLAATTEAQTQAFQKEQEIQNRRSSLLEQQKAKQKQNIEDLKKMQEDAAKEQLALAQRLLIHAKQNGIDTLKFEEQIIQRKAQLDSIGLKKNSEQRRLIEAQSNAEILALRVAHAQTMWENVSAIQRAQLSAARASALAGSIELENLELREAARQAEDKKRQLKADYDTQKIDKKRYEAELADVERNADLDKQATRNRFAAERINKDAELGKLLIQIEQNTNKDFLSTRRNQAIALINIEEKQQLDLLALQELGRKERETKEAAIVAESAARRKEVYRQILTDERADRKAMEEIRLAHSKDGSRKEFEAQKQLLRIQRDEELANTELTEKQKAAIRAKYRRKENDLEKERFDEEIDKAVKRANESIGILSNIFQAQANVQAQLIDEQEKAALASAGLSAEAREKVQQKFDEKRQAAEKKAAEQRRKLALAEAVVNTAGAVIKAAPNVFLMALAGLTGLAQIAIIESQKFARGGVIGETKMAKGGIVLGPSHAQGGVKYRVGNRNVELEGQEGVINKRSMAIPGVRQKASELNQLGGGVPFPGTMRISAGVLPRYNPNRLEYGGIISGASGGSSIDYNQLGSVVSRMVVNAVASMPAPIVGVEDIQNGVGRRVRVEQRAEIGI